VGVKGKKKPGLGEVEEEKVNKRKVGRKKAQPREEESWKLFCNTPLQHARRCNTLVAATLSRCNSATKEALHSEINSTQWQQ
jgi:hypothetical protein